MVLSNISISDNNYGILYELKFIAEMWGQDGIAKKKFDGARNTIKTGCKQTLRLAKLVEENKHEQ